VDKYQTKVLDVVVQRLVGGDKVGLARTSIILDEGERVLRDARKMQKLSDSAKRSFEANDASMGEYVPPEFEGVEREMTSRMDAAKRDALDLDLGEGAGVLEGAVLLEDENMVDTAGTGRGKTRSTNSALIRALFGAAEATGGKLRDSSLQSIMERDGIPMLPPPPPEGPVTSVNPTDTQDTFDPVKDFKVLTEAEYNERCNKPTTCYSACQEADRINREKCDNLRKRVGCALKDAGCPSTVAPVVEVEDVVEEDVVEEDVVEEEVYDTDVAVADEEEICDTNGVEEEEEVDEVEEEEEDLGPQVGSCPPTGYDYEVDPEYEDPYPDYSKMNVGCPPPGYEYEIDPDYDDGVYAATAATTAATTTAAAATATTDTTTATTPTATAPSGTLGLGEASIGGFSREEAMTT